MADASDGNWMSEMEEQDPSSPGTLKKRLSQSHVTYSDKSKWYTGTLSKAGSKGKSVMGMSNMKVRYFAMSPDGKLFYYDTKDDFESNKPPLNDLAFDLSQCVIKFDLSRSKSSRHHPIHITPKNWQGGERELILEARSAEVRDEWRNWIRAALAVEKAKSSPAGPTSPRGSPRTSASSSSMLSGPARRDSNNSSPHRGVSRASSMPNEQSSIRTLPASSTGSPRAGSPRSPRSSGPTPEEARTEVGTLLKECRLEEFTHKIVTVEKFSNLIDLRAMSPQTFDELSGRVGLKLGQSRKLKKRLGISLTDSGPKSPEPSSNTGGMSAATTMIDNLTLGMNLLGSPTSKVVEMTAREKEAWDMVQRLEGEVKLLRQALGEDSQQGSSMDAMLSGFSPFSSTSPTPSKQKRSPEQEIAIGKLLTHQIPVVVAFGDCVVGTIAHDAGDEDNAVRRLKFEEQDIGFDVSVHLFGEPLTVTSVRSGGPAALKGVEVGDLLIDANGSSIPTDRPEVELREAFAKFKRPLTLGFYKMRKANEASRISLLQVTNAPEPDIRAIANQVSGAGGIGGANQPQVLQVDGCPDDDCNGKYTIQPHKIVNGYARYLKNHSFYYLYKATTGYWMITWFEPDIDEDKGEYKSQEIVGTPEEPTAWGSGTSPDIYPQMVVYVHGSVPFQHS